MLGYLSQNTRLPIPRVTSWGLTDESPGQLDLFIIMDCVKGTSLTSL